MGQSFEALAPITRRQRMRAEIGTILPIFEWSDLKLIFPIWKFYSGRTAGGQAGGEGPPGSDTARYDMRFAEQSRNKQQ
jgi:hypothetical protein